MKIYYPATALLLQYMTISVTNAEDFMNAVLSNDPDALAEALYDDDEVLDCYADDNAFKEANPNLLAAEQDFGYVDETMMDVQVKGDKYSVKFFWDDSKKEVYRKECADIGRFVDMPTFEMACAMTGVSVTMELGNYAHCYAKTDACASQGAEDSEDSMLKALDTMFEAFGLDCEYPSGDNAFMSSGASPSGDNAVMLSWASTACRRAVASAIPVVVVFASLLL